VEPFERLDFIYQPSADVATDRDWFVSVLGARQVFAIDGMGTRVVMLELGAPPPHLLLAEHLTGDRPVLVFRVADLTGAMDALVARGWHPENRFEIPHGPICSFAGPGGHRIAIYELTRPQVGDSFAGRADF
jgi:hypothetical protein